MSPNSSRSFLSGVPPPHFMGSRARAVCGFQGNTQGGRGVDSIAQGHSEPLVWPLKGRRVGSEETLLPIHGHCLPPGWRTPLTPGLLEPKKLPEDLAGGTHWPGSQESPSRLTPPESDHSGRRCPHLSTDASHGLEE